MPTADAQDQAKGDFLIVNSRIRIALTPFIDPLQTCDTL
jgi:hypothetical protein